VTELFDAIASPWSLVWVLVVFGVAPGFVLRLLVLLYPKRDPRRWELVAELYAIPRLMRPMWVAEQIEVALFEGLSRRIKRLAPFCHHPVRLSCAIAAWAVGSFMNDYSKSFEEKAEVERLAPHWFDDSDASA